MSSNVFIAFFAALGAAIWVYGKFSHRASGRDFVKTITPAFFTGVIVFITMLVLLSQFF